MARKSGTVIPLNYGYHLEHAVAIVDTDWNRLADLLEDPNRYFHKARKSWKIHGPPDVIDNGWIVEEPATAILTPIHKSFHMVSQALMAAGATGIGGVGITQEERSLKGMATLLENKEFQEGFFVVQFALKTSVIHIGYFPPTVKKSRYNGGFTRPTICKFGTPGLTCLSAHVDLAEPPSGYSFRNIRAAFLLDLISDYGGFLDAVNGDIGYLLDCQMVPDTATASGMPSINVPPVPRSMEAVSSKYVLTPSKNFKSLALPTVTVDQMGSEELPGTPCVWPKAVSTTTEGDITYYESEDVVVKYYPIEEEPPTDPSTG